MKEKSITIRFDSIHEDEHSGEIVESRDKNNYVSIAGDKIIVFIICGSPSFFHQNTPSVTTSNE